MPAPHIARSVALVVLALTVCACATKQVSPAPEVLRGKEFVLVRVDGQLVHGTGAVVELPNSPSATVDCQDRVADGSLLISKDGRGFTYKSTMRNCSGAVLATETNEGRLATKDTLLTFVIERTSGSTTFLGNWNDSTVRIFDLGGRLEFARP